MSNVSFLATSAKERLAYVAHKGRSPCVIFLGGFKSDMTGSKAAALDQFCRENGQAFVRFDYFGHGQSSGDFRQGTIGQWKRDALSIIDALGGERVILVGSSMGAWIALLVARERKERVKAFMGIASAPDFTERLIWDVMTETQKREMMEKGEFQIPDCYGKDPYPITRMLIEEARNHLLLNSDIKLDIPIRLLHGTKDADVPWKMAVELSEKLTSKDVTLTLIKDGDHRLSSPAQLSILCDMLNRLSRQVDSAHP